MLKGVAIFFITIFVFGVGVVFSYDNINTHPQLSRAAENVYNNSTNPNKISVEQMKWIEYGAAMEDTDPRYLNHFYNPKTSQGLKDGFWSGMPAKEWAQKQTSATGDYGYQAILNNYKLGNKDRAWQGVGHILHLIQDMSVPAHVRNDGHGEGDVYEAWAQQFGKISTNNVSKISASDLNQVFDNLATYTYDNFYSKDTIISGDKKIIGGVIKSEKDINNKDADYVYFNGYKIVKVKSYKSGNEYSIDYSVNQSYWSILSPKAIGYSAGVIELFANEFKKIDDQKAAELANMSLLQKLSYGLKKVTEPAVTFTDAAYTWGDIYMVVRPTVVGEFNAILAAANLTGKTIGAGNELIVDTSKTVGDKLAVAAGEVKGVFVSAAKEEKPAQIISTTVQDLNKAVQSKDSNVNEVKVARVIDGDTIELVTGEKVRYIGVDTPELNGVGSADDECLAWAAKVRNEQLIQSGQVRLVGDVGADKDTYGRLLRYAYAGNTFVNGQLANEGFAKAFFCQAGWINCPVTTDATRKKIIQDAANAAIANKRGLYSGVCAKEVEIVKDPVLILVEENKTEPKIQELAKGVQVFFSNGVPDNPVVVEDVVIILDDGINNNDEEATTSEEDATSTDEIATSTDELETSTPDVATTSDEVAVATDPEIDINNVVLTLFGLDTGSEDFTGSTTVGIRIDGISSRAEYYLSEYDDGLTEESAWLTEEPENFTISDNDFEQVNVYLWIKQNDNILPGYVLGSIILDREGPEINFNQAPATSTIATEASFNVNCVDDSQDYVNEKYSGEKAVTWNYKLDNRDLTLGYDGEDIDFSGLAEGEHVLSVEAVDRALNIASSSYVWTVNAPASLPAINARANYIVISEIQVASQSSSTEEFIELHNPNVYDVDISNYRLTRKTKSGAEYNLLSSFSGSANYRIPKRGFFLISNKMTITRDGAIVRNADAVYTVSDESIAANNTIILYSDAGQTVVDKVGFGTASDYEGQPLVNIPAGSSAERKALWNSTYASMNSGVDRYSGNAFDSNNNFNDFIIRTNPEPQNRTFEQEPWIPRLW
ncbi:lamin tail domain-containing protein [Candidatus Parcubacteria bacterium]|nr:lamin tail domain-containing protein [Patescibacteria group bacterium]MBU4308928.1 lamin tail domain-containing protein [Patescibacteria group bacterium]MBU4431818.1 lamin tail domain-containing protein [Patescibacteria group bacterium]MBU4577288.1 lamin tail domain-containing protein [Patescibacteria group bacterium]MCG2696978.1 lamin tail domain-containing protein [Candidatus Parcubacteria bacterium]